MQGMLSRRALLRASLGTSAGLAGILLARQAPVLAQERELKLLTWSHFVPSSDEELQRQLEEFGKMAGIKVRMDRVAHLQLPAVLASEVQGQKGHDITIAGGGNPHLYADHLVVLDDLHDKIGRSGGGWTNLELGKGPDNHYHAIPWYFISFPIAIRTDLVAEIGEDLPDTWEDVHRIGKKLKAKGHPVGIQLAHSADSNHILRGIIWSWGGKLVEADGKTVAINSKETVEAYKFIKALYEDCMEPEVLAWDDRNNNVCLNSGKCSMILNPISAYNSARKDNALIPGTNIPIHIVINHIMPPKGAGRAAHVGGTQRHWYLEVLAGAGLGQAVPRVPLPEGAAGAVHHGEPGLQPAAATCLCHASHLRLQSQVLLCALHWLVHARSGLAGATHGGHAGGVGSLHHSRHGGRVCHGQAEC
ncbi:MAG: hypothetical protein KatS3mg131_2839 [Candidatus Tectimicrobiota bacterium]|nr:MAG: hypothetical protein KatS3mg131_2839 [Candidatus Tectomicrobia bacterium]